MNVADAKRELAQIAERQAELQKIVDAAPKSLLPDPSSEGHAIKSYMRRCNVSSGIEAQKYADALDTLLMLRHQPGTEAVNAFSEQFMVTVDVNRVYAIGMYPDMRKITRISPCFATEADAQAAIDTIGADRILRMFRTLHGVA